MYLTYHSYGQYVLYGWGYDNFDPPNVDQLRSMGNAAANAMKNVNGGSEYSVGGASKILYPASGNLCLAKTYFANSREYIHPKSIRAFYLR